jgi:hypothetical protein
MNLHDFILSVDGKRAGFGLRAAGRKWTVCRSVLGGAWYLQEEETGAVLLEGIWAALPSEGWSVADGSSKT